MLNILYCAIGGAIGATMRYAMVVWTQRLFNSTFPWGTLNVNLIGSFLIGLLWAMSEVIDISPNLRIFLMIGLLGSFTTFSTFSFENVQLLRDSEIKLFLINVLLSNVGGIVCAIAGFMLAKFALSIVR